MSPKKRERPSYRYLLCHLYQFNGGSCPSLNSQRIGVMTWLDIAERRGTVPNFDYNGVYQLLLVNFLIFAADHLFHLPGVSQLYLNHTHPRWWQYLTAAFCHGSWAHISNNAFMLLVFGRIVEEEVIATWSSLYQIAKMLQAVLCWRRWAVRISPWFSEKCFKDQLQNSHQFLVMEDDWTGAYGQSTPNY